MGGTDTARGMNFQYACAIGYLIDFLNHPNWAMIQLEGDEDIEDIVVFNNEEQVLLRVQIKQKTDPYQWQPREVEQVLRAFSTCSDFDQTQYHFVYAGSEGRDFANKLKPILSKVYHEGWQQLGVSEVAVIDNMLAPDVKGYISQVGNRLALIKRESWQSIEAQDLRRLRKLLVQNTSLCLEEDIESNIYDGLFHAVAQKTEGKTKYSRRFSRQALYTLLRLEKSTFDQPDFDLSAYIQWVKTTIEKWSPLVSLVLQDKKVLPDILSLVVKVESESALTSSQEPPMLIDVVKQLRRIVVVGEPGAGKTASLWQVALAQFIAPESTGEQRDIATAILPVYVNLTDYDGESIEQLIKYNFQIAGQIISEELIHSKANEGRFALLFDDLDMVREYYLRDILQHIRKWMSVYKDCTILVSTSSPSDGHKLGLPTFQLLPLDYNQAQQILLGLENIEWPDTLAILHSLPPDSNHLVTSPLTLRMLAHTYLYAERHIPKSRGALYKAVVEGILIRSEDKWEIEFDKSDKLNLLILLAQWMQNNEVYCVSPARLGSLIHEWINSNQVGSLRVAHLKSCHLLNLRAELIRSGLLRRTLDGDIEFIHPTFRAYLAALSITKAELPKLLARKSWHNSLVLWTSIFDRHTTDALLDLLVEYPVILGQIVRERAERRSSVIIDNARMAYFEKFNVYFNRFLKLFPALLSDSPWNSVVEGYVELFVAQSPETGYMLTWQASEQSPCVRWITCEELTTLAKDITSCFPLPIWLLPTEVIQKYHPLEMAYLWSIRSLFDLLLFTGWVGGLDVMTFGEQIKSHPAVALIANRFTGYHDFASGLPLDIREQLPFYAQREFDLAIEVHEYLNPPIVRYAITPGRKAGNVSVVQTIIQDADPDQCLFKRNEDGSWYYQLGENIQIVPAIEEVDMIRLLSESSGSVAQKWLRDDLTRHWINFSLGTW